MAGLTLLVFVVLLVTPQIFSDGDTGWHIAAGRWMLAHARPPSTDPLSLSFAGHPWVAHEWLAEIAMAAAYASGGWSGLSVLFAATVAVLIMVLGTEVGRWLPPIRTLIVLIMVLVCLIPAMLARPHVVSWLLLAIWLVALLRSREDNRTPPLVLALPLMLVWANLHASFLLGLGIAGLFGLEALAATQDRAAALRQWLPFVAAILCAALLTPYGVDGLLYAWRVSSMATLDGIQEWQPTVPVRDFTFALTFLLALAALLHRGVQLPWARLLLLMSLIFLAFLHVRHQMVLAIAASLLLARPLAATWTATPASIKTPKLQSRGRVIAFVGFALVLSAIRLAVPLEPPDNPANPRQAISQVRAELRRRPVFNGYSFGGPLSLAGIKPYIDGRADMYGDEFVIEYDRMVSGDMPAFRRAADHWHIGWTILPPDAPLVAALDREPGWHRLVSDRWAVVHVRTNVRTPPASAPAV